MQRIMDGMSCIGVGTTSLLGLDRGSLEILTEIPSLVILVAILLWGMLSPRVILMLCALAGARAAAVGNQNETADVVICVLIAIAHACRIPHDFQWWLNAPSLATATRDILVGPAQVGDSRGRNSEDVRQETRAKERLLFREIIAPTVGVCGCMGFAMSLQVPLLLTGTWGGVLAWMYRSFVWTVLVADILVLGFDAVAPRLCPAYLARASQSHRGDV